MPLKSFRTLLEEPDVKFGQERLIKVLAAVAGPNMKFGNYDVNGTPGFPDKFDPGYPDRPSW
jgi:hypothetical protein